MIKSLYHWTCFLLKSINSPGPSHSLDFYFSCILNCYICWHLKAYLTGISLLLQTYERPGSLGKVLRRYSVQFSSWNIISLTSSIADSSFPTTLVGVRRNLKFPGVALMCKSHNQQEHLSLHVVWQASLSTFGTKLWFRVEQPESCQVLCWADAQAEHFILPLNLWQTEEVQVQSPSERKWRWHFGW